MKYFIFQGSDHDCGYAALKMLLAHIARDKSFLYLKKPDKKDSFTLQDLCNISSLYGVELVSYQCDKDYFDRLKPLTITLIDNKHAVLIKKVTKNYICFYDPGFGKIKLKRKDFLNRWNRIILEIEDASHIKKIDKIEQEILPKKLRILEAIISIFSSGVLVTTFYLLNNEQNAVFSIIFLGLFATAQILENFITYRQIYHYDKKFIKPYFNLKKNQNKLNYLEFISFKREYFTKNRGFLSSILVAILITFLLCFNDFKNMFVILALVLFKLLESILFSKGETNIRKEISECEEKCFEGTARSVEFAERANELANTSVCQNSMKSIFYMIACFAFALVMMIVSQNSGCNFVIFHFVLYYVCLNSYASVIESLSNRKEYLKSKQRFFDSCNL